MKLYGSEQSGHAYKVRLFLTLAQVEHDYIWVDLMLARKDRPAEFMNASKHGEVPVLVDGDATICQSNAILKHLSETTGHFNGGYEVNEWLAWEANRIGFSLPNYRFSLIWQKPAQEVLDYLQARLLFDLKLLNKHLAATGYLVGDSLTIADISNAGYMYWLEDVGVNVSDYPNIEKWLKNITSMPHYQTPPELMSKP